jgi:hypothetical protein
VPTPDDVLNQIREVRAELLRGPSAIEQHELDAERAEDAAQLAQDKALLAAEGSIPEKQAHSRIASAEQRDAAFIARAKFNRVKTKIRALESALVSLQAELKWMKDEGA